MALMLILSTLDYNNFISPLTVKRSQRKLEGRNYIAQGVVLEGQKVGFPNKELRPLSIGLSSFGKAVYSQDGLAREESLARGSKE